MTERMIENRVNKLRALEAQQKELEAQAEAIRAELKADLEEKGVDELKTKNFILRWKEIISNRLDGKALKAALPDVYGQFCKASTSRHCMRKAPCINARQSWMQEAPTNHRREVGSSIIPASRSKSKGGK